jgi:1,4-alpha-glucan branching enzyme
MPEGYVVLVLHAHLPYVIGHGKWPHGSDWLCEAVSETYIPLLNLLHRLSAEGRHAGFTVGITPVLCEMLASPDFPPLFEAYCVEKTEAARRDGRTFALGGRTKEEELAEKWGDFYSGRLRDFEQLYRRDLLAAFRHFQDIGQVDIIASAATHAYLPLLDLDGSINAQISQGAATYERYFYRKAAGIWLPECAYRPAIPTRDRTNSTSFRKGLESFLIEGGFNYFFLDEQHFTGDEGIPGEGVYGRQRSTPLIPLRRDHAESGRRARDDYLGSGRSFSQRGRRGQSFGLTDIDSVYSVFDSEAGACAFFTRNSRMSQQVWSAERGYPGDPYYLEFHKKHSPGGLRYWRVTDREGDLGNKELYDVDRAGERVREHACHFVRLLEGALEEHYYRTGKPGVITLSFDAELFGHWWFEGADWLYELVSDSGGSCAKIEKASTVLHRLPPPSAKRPNEGSWGEGGGHLIWYNTETAWTWEYIREAERHMVEAVKHRREGMLATRILSQMAREVFLMQASDWQFLMSTGSADDYARSRFLSHWEAFDRLRTISIKDVPGDEDVTFLDTLEKRDALFQDVAVEWFLKA